MPRKVINDYTFYKIVCLDNSVELCYIGSTADFNKRKSAHKCNCINENYKNYNLKIYNTIRDNGGWDNFKMIEIDKKEQITLREAEQIEEEYRQKLKANMNMRICYLTEEDKIEQHKKSSKKYYENNKDKIKEQNQNYYEEHRDKNKNKREYKSNKNMTEFERIEHLKQLNRVRRNKCYIQKKLAN